MLNYKKINLKISRVLRFLWEELVYGGHLISLGSVSVIFTCATLLKIAITWDFLIISYFITYTIYLYNRYKEIKKDFLTNPQRTQHISKYIKHIPFIIFCCILMIIGMLLYFGKSLFILYFGLLIFLLGLFYTIFFKNFTQQIIGFKNLYVAFIWVLLSVFFLSFYYYFPLNLSLILISIFVFLRCFVGTSFYDIKDIESDRKEKLLTLAIILQKRKLIKFLKLVSVLSFLPIIIGIYIKLFPLFSLMLLFVIPVQFYFFNKINIQKANFPYLSEIALGTEKILWTFFILLGKTLC